MPSVLFVLVDPLDHSCFNVDQMWDQIQLTLDPLKEGVSFTRLENPTSTSFSRSLQAQDWDILHFITVTQEREGAFSSIALLAADGRVRYCPVPHLAREIAARGTVKTVVLQVCGGSGLEAHVAEALIDAGIATVVLSPLFTGRDQRKFLACVYRNASEGLNPGDLSKQLAAAELTGAVQIHSKASAPPIHIGSAARKADLQQEATVSKQIDVSSEHVEPPAKRDGSKLAQARRYDVFLCHNSRDKPFIHFLAENLTKAGLVPWFDVSDMSGGDFRLQLEDAIENSKIALICIGPHGIGGWQQVELSIILNAFVRKEIIAIPVWLPNVVKGEEPKLSTLGVLHWIDFRKASPVPMDALMKTIRSSIEHLSKGGF